MTTLLLVTTLQLERKSVLIPSFMHSQHSHAATISCKWKLVRLQLLPVWKQVFVNGKLNKQNLDASAQLHES